MGHKSHIPCTLSHTNIVRMFVCDSCVILFKNFKLLFLHASVFLTIRTTPTSGFIMLDALDYFCALEVMVRDVPGVKRWV